MKNKIYLFAIMLMFSSITTTTYASSRIMSETTSKEDAKARVMEIKQRVDEIRLMDFSQLSKTERKDLRHELKDMKQELRSSDPTFIYISGGALLLIIILLILLL